MLPHWMAARPGAPARPASPARDDWLRGGGPTQAGQSDFLSPEAGRTLACALGLRCVDLAGRCLWLVKATGLLRRTPRQPMESWRELSNHKQELESSRDFPPALSFLSFLSKGPAFAQPYILTGGWLPILICLATESTANKQRTLIKRVPCTHRVNQSDWSY